MHEVGLMQSALETVARVAKQNNLKRVSCIGLRIGLLSGVVPEALEFAFEVLRNGTVAAEAKLQIEVVPARFWCQNCQTEFTLEQFEFECPRCGGQMVLQSGSAELNLVFVEGESIESQNNSASVEHIGELGSSTSGCVT